MKMSFLYGFSYIHYSATDVFSMDPPRDYISSLVVNQKSVAEREWEWSESPAVKGSAEDWLWVIEIDCDWQRLYKKVLIIPTIQS
jgi:hypothetical protein